MTENINQVYNHLQGQSDVLEEFTVFRFTHSLGKGIKSRIKSYGCTWNCLHQGWVCPIAKQEEIKRTIHEAKLEYEVRSVSLPKGMISSDPKIASKQARLEILEEQYHKEDIELFKEIYHYDDSFRPEDFVEPRSDDGKSPWQIRQERDFYERVTALQKKKETINSLRDELDYLSQAPQERVFDSDAPLSIAESLIQENYQRDGVRTIQYCSGSFWGWDGIKYAELSDGAMRQKIYSFLRDAKQLNTAGHFESFNPNKFKVDQIMDALRAICHQCHNTESGAIWLDGREAPTPKHLITFRNGLLSVEGWWKDPVTALIPHTPLLLNVNSLNFDFDPEASEPKEWQKFLNDVWPEDKESQFTLQEWAGYLLVQETRQHKILLIVGPPRSGKGTIGRVLHELLGPFNVAGPTLSSLGGEFGLQPLLNKMLATISDARLNGRMNNGVIIERLLSISGEDPLTINRKFLPPLTVQLPTRLMMMSNELPNLRDASGALAKRYIVLTLQKSWLGEEDITLFSRLREELAGILVWALEGLARLQKRGRFIQPASSIQTIEDLEAMTSPIKAFIAERCQIGSQEMVSVDLLFDNWRSWCTATGYPHAGNVQTFGKNLRAACPGIEIIRPQEGLMRERYYRRIGLISFSSSSADAFGQG